MVKKALCYLQGTKGLMLTYRRSDSLHIEGYWCRLKKSIYGLKQTSRQWYLKFDSTIRKFGFQENVEDNCIYAKFKNGKYIFLVLNVDDILLASSDVSLLLETKKFLSSKFDMKDLGEASFVLEIEIHRDREKRF